MGKLCDDPVVRAGTLAKQEADDALRNTICTFIQKYGVPDPELERAQISGKPPTNIYCSFTVNGKATGKSHDWELKRALVIRPKVMIAVLPDPVHTQLALRFDESADELQNSMQDLGWIYDRAWLPWDKSQHEEAEDFAERVENKTAQEKYETSPGAILFRPNSSLGATQPLVLLVVGDTPTGGVNPEPFREAIEIWQQLTGWNNYFNGKRVARAPPTTPTPISNSRSTNATDSNQIHHATDPTIRNVEVAPDLPDAADLEILGPTYSGSAPSLKALLREVTAQTGTQETPDGYVCPVKTFNVTIVSGTVSDGSELQSIGANSKACPLLAVRPMSLAIDLTYEYQRVLHFLNSHLGTEHSVFALLSEAESDFGGILAPSKQEEKQEELEAVIDRINRQLTYNLLSPKEKLRHKDLNDDSLHSLDENSLHGLKDDALQALKGMQLIANIAPLHYYFPRGISSLRTAYEQNNIFGFNSDANSIRTQLHLSLSDSARGDDTVHTFSGNQQAAALEAEMAQLAADLERQKVTVVVMSATDVLDELFVTRYLAQHAPNIAVVVTDTDGLFLRGGDSSIENTYVASPWPLITGNEEWSVPRGAVNFPPVRFHDSASGQGLYSAVRLLMCSSKAATASLCGAMPHPPSNVSLREYQPPIATWAAKGNSQKFEPPIWLSAIGHGGFWPVALIDIDQVGEGLPNSISSNLPRLVRIQEKDAKEEETQPIYANGIIESNPTSITIATGLIALLLALHGLACIRARLDRSYAWSYALSDQAHHRLRQTLQIVITMSAVPALVLLKTRIEAGISIRSPFYTECNWILQFIALALTVWPLGLLAGAWPWPTTRRERIRGAVLFVVGLLAETAFLFFCNWRLWDLIAPSPNQWPTERAFFFYRSGHLLCGSAPTLPVLLLGASLVLYAVSMFDRLVFYGDRIPVLPTSSPDLRCPGPTNVRRLNGLLGDTWDPWRWGLLGAVLILLVIFVLSLHDIIPRSLAHGRFDIAVVALSAINLLLLAYDLATAITAWSFLRADCLLPLSMSPMRWGFTWIKGWSWKRLWAPGTVSSDGALEHLRRLNEANRRAMKDSVLADAFAATREHFYEVPRDPAWAGRVTRSLGELNRQLAISASEKLVELDLLWSADRGPITGSDAAERGKDNQIELEKLVPAPAPSPWTNALDRMAKEEFVALLYLGYIRMVLLQIRNRIMTATGMYILLLWALTGYPFMNHHSIVIGLTCLLIVLGFEVIWIYSNMHRDDILSRTTETTSGKLDVDFFAKTLSMVGIPVLTLVASQFPEVSNMLFSWLEPGLSSMK